MRKTIEIPEGYEARIEGNMIIFVPKESEDERIRQDCIKYLDWEYQHCSINEDKIKIEKCIAWLEKQGSQNLANSAKTCKDEQKPAWSDEDESKRICACKFLDDAKHEINYAVNHKDDIDECITWLKSLKERYTWKPSDEQIKGIECAIKTLQYQLNVGDKRLDSLYNDLKKLKG